MIERFHCGWQVNPGDTGALISLLDKLAEQRHLIFEAGTRARQAFERNYDRPIGAARILKFLDLIPEPRNTLHSGVSSGGQLAFPVRGRPDAALCNP